MKKTFLEIYALAICFVIIICFSVTSAIAAYDILQLVKPELTLNAWNYEKFQSNNNFCVNNTFANKAKCININAPEVTKMRLETYAIALKTEQRNGLQSLIICCIILLINVIVFVPHWIIARNARFS